MPHKHKRKRGEDISHYDLDPSQQAAPLSAYKPPSVFSSELSNKRRKPSTRVVRMKVQDDTPKAFARMMAWQATGKVPSGLDDGPGSTSPHVKSSSKRTKKGSVALLSEGQSQPVNGKIVPMSDQKSKSSLHATPQILPGESLSQFALRVDQSLPLNSMPRSSASNPNIPSDIKPQARITKHNKKLQRLISGWRETDAKLKEKREEEDDDVEEKLEEEDLLWEDVAAAKLDRKGKKKNKTKGTAEDDPWKDLEKQRRAETKQKNLQDVVKAPPSLIKVKSKFKVKDDDFLGVNGKSNNNRYSDVGVDVKDVPNAVGSLRRREEIGKTRKEVIEDYRKLKGKRLKGKGLSHPLPQSITT